jgi:ATP-dependent DNA helicase PIF1
MIALMGTAAAFLNGSIYHSILGISDGEFISAGTLAQIRARLDGVNYIFLDKVSMVSCCDLYRISAQVEKACGVLDEPFGRIIFIFLVILLSYPQLGVVLPCIQGNVSTQMSTDQLLWQQQQSSIGKAL